MAFCQGERNLCFCMVESALDFLLWAINRSFKSFSRSALVLMLEFLCS